MLCVIYVHVYTRTDGPLRMVFFSSGLWCLTDAAPGGYSADVAFNRETLERSLSGDSPPHSNRVDFAVNSLHLKVQSPLMNEPIQ